MKGMGFAFIVFEKPLMAVSWLRDFFPFQIYKNVFLPNICYNNKTYAINMFIFSFFFTTSIGLTCQHVSQAVDVHNVKRAVAQNVWSICSECLKERRICDGEPVMPSDIWLCLKCGTQVNKYVTLKICNMYSF